MFRISLLIASTTLFATGFLHAGPVLEIKNKEGKILSAELLALDEDRVKMRKSATQGAFFIPLDKLDPKSVELLKEEAAKLPVKLPAIEIDVSVKTRRRHDSGSTYMKAMTVGVKVAIENRNMKLKFPPSKGRIVFVGQDQKTPEKYEVLATRDFDFSIAGGATFEVELDEFVTKYDSDNKGDGNIGGYKYEGYLLMIHDEKKNLLHYKTVYATISKAIDSNPGILKDFLTIKAGTALTKNMVP
ncbi:MAG: hypothetical protein ACSHX7_08795 [Luteolibacter sp.]